MPISSMREEADFEPLIPRDWGGIVSREFVCYNTSMPCQALIRSIRVPIITTLGLSCGEKKSKVRVCVPRVSPGERVVYAAVVP